MSEEPPKPNSDKPPRISLPKGNGNGNGDHPAVPDPETLSKPGESAPPKINVPKMPSKGATSRVDLSPAGVTLPKDKSPGIDLSSDEALDPSLLDQTMKIDLSGDAKAAGPAGTSRIELTATNPKSPSFDPFDNNQTMRIDLSEGAAEDPKSATPPIPAPPASAPSDPAQAQTMRVDLELTGDLSAAADEEKKAQPVPPGETAQMDSSMQTMRVDLSAVEPASKPTPADTSMQTMRVDLSAADPASEPTPADISMQTMSVDLSAADPASEPTPADTSMQTMRIDIPAGIPSKKKSETSRLSLGATQSLKEATSELENQETKSKSGTIRLGDEGELHQLVENQDSLSQQTMKIELDEKNAETSSPQKTSPIATAPIPPVAPGSVDLGEMMSSEPAKAAKAGSPKTIRMRKPNTPPPTRVLKKPPAPEQTIRVHAADPTLAESKSGTTRIELPEGNSPDSGDKKTIRIRRPGGAPGVAAMPTARRPSSLGKRPEPMADALGWGYTVVAVITAILAGVTIYVLAAQFNSIPMDGQSLPWPGRIL
jgi:hypothetical protein